MHRILSLVCAAALLASCKQDAALPQPRISGAPDSVLAAGSLLTLSADRDVAWLVPDSLRIRSSSRELQVRLPAGRLAVEALLLADSSRRDTAHLLASPRAALLNRLRAGGLILYFRHAYAQQGVDRTDFPAGWHWSCSPDTARQLSPEGLAQLPAMAEAFRLLELPLEDTVWCSEFCRVRRSAEGWFPGAELQIVPALTYLVYDEPGRQARIEAFIASRRPGARNSLIVAHAWGEGTVWPELKQAACAVFRPGSSPEFLGILTDSEFRVFK
ncbi:MAG: hypothetical protein NW241_17760 [Bacteroidia bacterium]|nr:hypothetical protein [Bacteroidia bacterium]